MRAHWREGAFGHLMRFSANRKLTGRSYALVRCSADEGMHFAARAPPSWRRAYTQRQSTACCNRPAQGRAAPAGYRQET
jgi:hypothetical protein